MSLLCLLMALLICRTSWYFSQYMVTISTCLANGSSSITICGGVRQADDAYKKNANANSIVMEFKFLQRLPERLSKAEGENINQKKRLEEAKKENI